MTIMSLDSGQFHELRECFRVGHDQNLIIGQYLVVPSGNNGCCSALDGKHAEKQISIVSGDFIQFFIRQR